MARRDASPPGSYATSTAEEPVPAPVLRWQREVHVPGIYDFEVDTTILSPEECADPVRRLLEHGRQPTAFRALAADAVSSR